MEIDNEGRPQFAPAKDTPTALRVETRKIPIPPVCTVRRGKDCFLECLVSLSSAFSMGFRNWTQDDIAWGLASGECPV